jgi:hypothetical protein
VPQFFLLLLFFFFVTFPSIFFAFADVATPHNCPCARGGRKPTEFKAFIHSIPYMTVTNPPPHQPERDPSDLFSPVTPFVGKRRVVVAPTLPGEVVSTTAPVVIDDYQPVYMGNAERGNINRNVELPKRPAVFVYYPQDSDEAKAFEGGVKKGDVSTLFGREVSADGYFYGDFDAEVESKDYTRKSRMPSSLNIEVMPERDAATDMTTTYLTAAQHTEDNNLENVFSLSLQDVKVDRTFGDANMLHSSSNSVQDLEDAYPPVDFSVIPGLEQDMQQLVGLSSANAKRVPGESLEMSLQPL